jgi:dUTP pyrophosphatase
MNIKIKYLENATKIVKVEGNKSDWYDLYTYSDVNLLKNDFKLINLGVAMKLPEGYEAHIVPRSSTFSNYGIIQTNGVGIIDNSYCGPDDLWRFPALATRTVFIPKNTRICQFRLYKKQENIDFIEDSLSNEKNRSGFGSTGI